MSKSGIYAHFGSKQDLQLATVDEAERIFQAEVIEPALAAPPGLGQLVAICDAFFDHLERRTFPGGCFFAGAVLKMGAHPGPVKVRLAKFQSGLSALIHQFIVTALEQRELPADEDPDALHVRAQRRHPRRQLQLRPPPRPERPRHGKKRRPPTARNRTHDWVPTPTNRPVSRHAQEAGENRDAIAVIDPGPNPQSPPPRRSHMLRRAADGRSRSSVRPHGSDRGSSSLQRTDRSRDFRTIRDRRRATHARGRGKFGASRSSKRQNTMRFS